MPAPKDPGCAREKDTAGPKGPLAILLACPKCGAPFTADDSAVSVTCAHCGSLLVLSAPGRDEIYVADDVVRGEEDVRDILIEYRVQAERAEIVARHSDGEGNPPAELFIQMQLDSFERRLRESVQIVDF